MQIAAATCADLCPPLGGALTCVGGGDAGGAEAGAHSYLPGAPAVSSATVFIVHTLPGVQSKHAVRYQAERGQEANLFICQLLGE